MENCFVPYYRLQRVYLPPLSKKLQAKEMVRRSLRKLWGVGLETGNTGTAQVITARSGELIVYRNEGCRMRMLNRLYIRGKSQSLILGPRENEYLSVVFESEGVRFEIKIYLHNDAQSLALFFKDLGQNWQGWNGTKKWKSIESDFNLEGTHDGRSHIDLKVSLIKNQGEENECRFFGKLIVDLTSLETIATEVSRIFSLE